MDINEVFRGGGRAVAFLDQINKASIVMLDETGLVAHALAVKIARGIAQVIDDERKIPPTRSADYLDYEPRLLAAAGSKLAKPALSASYDHWRAAWQDEQKQEASMTASEKIAAERAKHDVTLAELTKVRDELARAREAALNGTAREEELARQRAEEAEREKEKRVAHLGEMGVRRLMNQGLTRGWSAWHGLWSESKRQR
jgi:hypothetical protein